MTEKRAVPATKTEYEVILAMCKAHDLEEAAQMGEPSPWTEEGEADENFVHDRMWAMHGAFEVAKAYFEALTPAMTGFLPTLTDEQKLLARDYRGDDSHGVE